MTYALQLNGDKRDPIDGHLGNPDIKFGVEIDGLAYHNGQDSFMRDRARQRALEADGWRIIRFAAKEVLNDPQKCFEETFWALRNARA